LQDPTSKNTYHKKMAGGVAQAEGPEFKPQHHKTTTKQKLKEKGKGLLWKDK
jgi:hypothetical protein